MSQTIKNLWNRNIAPCENCGSHDPAVKNLIGLIERNREKLSGELTAAQKEIFSKVHGLLGSIFASYAGASFL